MEEYSVNDSFSGMNASVETKEVEGFLIGSEVFPTYFTVILHILYNVVFVCGVVGNALVLYVIYSVPKMRTTTNLLLANLAVGDFMISTLCVPFTYISIVYGYWPFGYLLCKIVTPLNCVGVLVSAFTLIALAVEKYVAILHPLAPRLRKSRVWWIISAIWATAGITTTPIAVFSDVVEYNGTNNASFPICDEPTWPDENLRFYYNLVLMLIQYFIPVVVLAFTYTRITLVVWGLQHERPAPGEVCLNRNSRSDQRSKKAILLTLFIVLGFTVAWLPYNVNYIIITHFPYLYSAYVYAACHWLAMSHAFYNPVIYAYINTSFNNAFKDVYRKILCCMKNQAIRRCPSSSYSTTMSTVRWKSDYRKISIAPELRVVKEPEPPRTVNVA